MIKKKKDKSKKGNETNKLKQKKFLKKGKKVRKKNPTKERK